MHQAQILKAFQKQKFQYNTFTVNAYTAYIKVSSLYHKFNLMFWNRFISDIEICLSCGGSTRFHISCALKANQIS